MTKGREMDFANQIILGDCEHVLKDFPDNCVDLIFTSPPYADQRNNTYGGVKPEHYVTGVWRKMRMN